MEFVKEEMRIEMRIEGKTAGLYYQKERQELQILYRGKILYSNQIPPNHIIFTVDWIGEALVKSVVEHYCKKEKSRLELLAVARSLGWEGRQ